MKHNCKFLKTANGVMKVADTVLHPRGCHSSVKHWNDTSNINKFTKRKKRQKNPRVTSFDPIIM